MDYKVAGYVKLAKLWEKKEDSAIAYHKKYYSAKFDGVDGFSLVDVYIDITGKKEICKRLEMVRLIRDCQRGRINCIATQSRAYLAANTKEFCYLIKTLFDLPDKVEIITEDESYHVNTIINREEQRDALLKMANDYVSLNPQDFYEWSSDLRNAIYDLEG